jgi:hypothetical protein
MQIDYVHSRGWNEPMTPLVNFFEDPVTHFPQTPARFGRPFPAYTNITMTTSTGKSAYDGLQLGANARTRRITLGHAAGHDRHLQRAEYQERDQLRDERLLTDVPAAVEQLEPLL